MSQNKIFEKKDLVSYLFNIREKNLEVGFTNGCFDLLHKGHLSLLSQCRKKCDFLIVGLNSDLSVKLLKGKDRPIDNQSIRLEKLSNVKDVDALIVFTEETPINIINKLSPNVLFKGADYKSKKIVGSESVIKNFGRVEFIDILDGFSTTDIIKNSSV